MEFKANRMSIKKEIVKVLEVQGLKSFKAKQKLEIS